jgi:hypothetical protein
MVLGFLENSVPYPADVNPIAQIVALSLLLIGAYFTIIPRFRIHGRVMMSAILIELGTFTLWMAPFLIVNFGALGSGGICPAITVLHVFAGIAATTLAISAAAHWAAISPQLKWTMRAAFLAWVVTAVLGISFYAHYYLHI